MNQKTSPQDNQNNNTQTPVLPPQKPPLSIKMKVLRFLGLFALLLLLSLVGTGVLYFLSQQNHLQFRMVNKSGKLIIEKGRFLPWGFKYYVPVNKDLLPVYAPISLPEGIEINPDEIFNDRTDVDRALFGLLSTWARSRLDSTKNFDLIIQYIQRCEKLPGLTNEQQIELTHLRADIAFYKGKKSLKSSTDFFQKALKQFEFSIKSGTSHSKEALSLIELIQKQLQFLNKDPTTNSTAIPKK